MPITEAPFVDERTAFVRALVEWAKDDLGNDLYREIHAKRAAEEARLAARNKGGRPRKHRTLRPWQGQGFPTRQAWLESLLVVPRDTPEE